jgi:hypothetical protein
MPAFGGVHRLSSSEWVLLRWERPAANQGEFGGNDAVIGVATELVNAAELGVRKPELTPNLVGEELLGECCILRYFQSDEDFLERRKQKVRSKVFHFLERRRGIVAL